MNKRLMSVAIGLVLASPQLGAAQSAFYVQINTNASGRDVIGDAANEPSIAVDPNNPNRMAVGWRQFDTISSNFRQAGVAYTTNGGTTWTSSVLAPGQLRSDPVLRSDAVGNFYYSSLSSPTSGQVFKSADGGATWGPPINSFGGDKEWIAIDNSNGPGRGNIYEDWNVQSSSVPNRSFTRSTNGGASFENPTTGPNPSLKWGTLAVGSNGTLYAAGATLNQSGHLFAASTNAQFAAQTPTFTSQTINLGGLSSVGNAAVNPDGLLGQVSIATARNGNIYVLGSVNPPGFDPLDVMFIRSTNGGATWSSPIRINNNPVGQNSYQWFGALSVAPNGRIDAIWNDTGVSSSNHFSVLKYAYSFDNGSTWLGNTALTPTFDHTIGYPSQNKIGDYYDIVSDNLGANAVFAATFNGGQDVYYMRISFVPGDWNGDGKVDAADYVVWRNGLGTVFTQDHYNIWRAHFGQIAGSGAADPLSRVPASAEPLSAAVPEPATFVLLILAAAGVCLHRQCNLTQVSKLVHE
jgi:hypothetical protein